LDLGSGTGELLNGKNFLCLDISFKMAELCRERALLSICGDAEELPLKSESVPTAVAVVLDLHKDYENLSGQEKIDYLLGLASSREEEERIRSFQETYLEKFMKLNPLEKAKTNLRALYGELSGALHGTLFRELLQRQRIETVLPGNCIEASLEARVISEDIKRFTRYLKNLDEIVKDNVRNASGTRRS
jgi:SAM-dependent methyltransferase